MSFVAVNYDFVSAVKHSLDFVFLSFFAFYCLLQFRPAKDFFNFSLLTLQYQTVLQTNGDGTFSLIQVDPSTLTNNPSIITLPDGTTAQVQGVATVSLNNFSTFIFNKLNFFVIISFILKAMERPFTPFKWMGIPRTCKSTCQKR